MRITFFILCFLLALHARTQEEFPRALIDQLETVIDEDVQEADMLNQLDRLRIYFNHPLNINKATYEELEELIFLSPQQISDIIQHRERFGDFIAVEELQAIPSLNLVRIKALSNFVQVGDTDKLNVSIQQMLAQSRNELFFKVSQVLEEKRGYQSTDTREAPYQGDPNRVFVRWRNTFSNNLRMGFILEKDPGEAFSSDNGLTQFDYQTFHVYLKNYSSFLKTVALGDYTVSMGQGLIAHNNFGSGKSALISNVKRGGQVLRPYNSLRESEFQRGIGVTLGLTDKIQTTLFASRANRDGNVLNNENIDPENPLPSEFSSFQITGNHRTLSEIEDKNAIGMQTYGAVVSYRDKGFKLSLNGMANFFDGSLNRGDQLYNLYRFEGDHLHNASVDASYRFRNVNFFGESALASTGGSAHVYGALVGLSRRLSSVLVYRNYDKTYNAFQPNAFAESVVGNNERGFYTGLIFNISRNWTLRGYFDLWDHPWLKFGISKPSSGNEFLVRLDYVKKRDHLIYLQYTQENKEADYSSSFAIRQTGFQRRDRIRLHLEHIVSKGFKIRSRVEYSRFANPIAVENGYLLYFDAIYNPALMPFSFSSRIAFFDTDDYNSRIYAFENTVLYEFTIPPYFDQGIRYYLNTRFDFIKNLTLEFRIARSKFTRANQIRDPDSVYFIDALSSGNERIIGNTRTEVKMQVRWAF